MEENKILIIVDVAIHELLYNKNINIQTFFNEYGDVNKMDIIEYHGNRDYVKPLKESLCHVQPHHKKLILFIYHDFSDIIFKESEANPCKDLEIIINIMDGSTRIFDSLQITDYVVQYVFFEKLFNMNFKKYSIKTDEIITTQTFIDAFDNDIKYIELSLKLCSKLFTKSLKDVDFDLLNKMAHNSKKKVKINKLLTNEDLKDILKDIFRRSNPSGNEMKQKFLNLTYFMRDGEYKTINDILYDDCVNVKVMTGCTKIYHKILE